MRRIFAVAGMGIALIMSALPAWAASPVTTTTVPGIVYRADGSVASGTLLVSWPAFSTASNQAVAAGSFSTTIGADGSVSLNLAPNSGAYPAGTYYTAVYHLSDGTVSREYWVVPSAATAEISSVRAQLVPATIAVQPVSKSYVDSSIAAISGNYVPLAGGTMSGTLNTENTITKLPRVDVTHPDFAAGCGNAADPTGTNDSTCAIEAAIAWAENNKEGGNCPPVYFPPGTYKVSGDITDNGNIRYYADSATLSIANGHSVSIGNQVFSATVLLPSRINAPFTGPQDESLFNPTRSSSATNAITGKFRSYNWSGTIPGLAAYNYGQVNHYYENNFFLDTTPGCWGFATTCYNTQHGFNNLTTYVSGGGGTNVHTLSANFYSVGDHIGSENYITSFGGSIDGGGPEGTKGASYFVGEAGDTWTGTVGGGHGGAAQTTLYTNCSTDCGGGSYGVSSGTPASLGQAMLVDDEQSTVASGQIESITAAIGDNPGTVTVNVTSGAANLAVSTCEAILISNLNPTTDPSGSGAQTLTFTVSNVTGTCTAGGLLSFEGTNHEQAIITSVTAPSGGQQTITANIRLNHPSGSYIFENANSDAGLFADVVANHNGSLSFPVEILGIKSINGNTVVMWWRRWYAGTEPSFVGFPYGHMVLGQLGVGTLSNTGGTVSFQLFVPSQHPVFQNQSVIYISGATNAAFDGACTNLTFANFSTKPTTGTCTQAASSGQTSAGAYISLTDSTEDNPYGNSRVNFYQGAYITDPQDYSAPITLNGVTNYPVDGKYFQVEPNKMALNAGDVLVEHHSEPQFHNYEGTIGEQNPTSYLSNGIDIEMSGIYGNGGSWSNNAAYRAFNNTPNSQYQYLGGAMPATPMMAIHGMWSHILDLDQPPAPGSYVINSFNCPVYPSSCNDAGYFYGLYDFVGNGGSNNAQYYPATNTMEWNGPQQFNANAAVRGALTAAEINSEVMVDGVTYSNLNAAWGAAVAVASNSGKNQTVRLGPGTYNVSATLAEPTNGACVNLEGSGGATVNADSSAATTLNVPSNVNGDVFFLGNAAQAQGCTFRDFVLLANANASHGFELQWFRGLLIDNVTVNDTTAEGVLLGEESTANGHQANFLLRNVTVSYSASSFTPASRPAYGVHLQQTAIDSHMDDIVVRNALTAAVYNEGTGNTGYLVHGFGYPYTCTTGPCVNNAPSASAANASYASSYVIEDVGGGGSVWTDTYADSPSIAGFYIGANGVAIHGGHIQWPDLTSFPAANLAYVAASVTNNMLIADVSCLGMNSGVNWITYAATSGNPPTFTSVHNLTGCGNYVQDLNPAQVTGFSSGGANINDPSGAVPRVWSTPIAAASSYPAYAAQLYTGYQGDVFQSHFSGVSPFFNVTYQGTIRSNGGLALSTIINMAATLTLTPANKNVIANAVNGAQTITLPSCYTPWPDKASPTGLEFTIIKSDASANAVTLQTVSSQQINYAGALAQTLSITAAGKRTLVCGPDYNWYAY